MSHFIADPTDKANKGTSDERCLNCRQPFRYHYNGQCPEEDDGDAIGHMVGRNE